MKPYDADAEDALKRALDAVIGRKATPEELAEIKRLEALI